MKEKNYAQEKINNKEAKRKKRMILRKKAHKGLKH